MIVEHRKSKRIFVRVPIRVRGLDESGKEFLEDTTTVEISRGGARISLKSVPRFGTTLEVTNLSSKATAPFLLIHPCPETYSGLPEWGIASLKSIADFWGIAFGETAEQHELIISALLACKECGRKEMLKLTQFQYRGLEEDFLMSHACAACQKTTSWEIVVREDEEPAGETARIWTGEERRVARRLTVNAPILVATPQGVTELTESYDLSTKGMKFSSALELEYGDQIQVTVNYGQGESARAEACRVVWRQPKEKASRYLYGVEFAEEGEPSAGAES